MKWEYGSFYLVITMSDNIAIQVRGLGKKYTIGGPQEKYHTFRDAIANSVKAPFRRLAQRGASQFTNDFWALKDVSFDVHKGEVIGIIGRNGAGKSTLLKILSQITMPTEGEIDIFGRVGSLLEVGTGFHPELTGRENIFLSGSILGMRKREIEAKLDDIVKFSEIEKFLDTPVKRYSSGMYVRLAFAVAAHLEPEILLVDEVLAVGDAAFQKKCLGKMGEVAKEGRTVLFVSHNMAAVQSLCKRVLLFDGGNLIDEGLPRTVISKYLGLNIQKKSIHIENMLRIVGGDNIRITDIGILNENGETCKTFKYNDKMILRFCFKVKIKKINYFAIEWTIISNDDTKVIYCSSSPQGHLLIVPEKEYGHVECHITHLPLTSGTYFINCLLSIPHQERLDQIERAIEFEIISCDMNNTGFDVNTKSAYTTLNTEWLNFQNARSYLSTDDH